MIQPAGGRKRRRQLGHRQRDAQREQAAGGQPSPMAAPPTLQNPCGNDVMPPARMQMIDSEMAKFENPLIRRSSSWP